MNEKLRVKVDGKWYTVEVGDLSARPIRAVVDGHAVEVSVEPRRVGAETPQSPPAKDPTPVAAQHRSAPTPPPARVRQAVQQPPSTQEPRPTVGTAQPTGKAIRAPMPGTILSIAVRVGDRVQAGDTVCILEAMKMQQSLRAEWPGVVSAVYASAGDHLPDDAPIVEIS